MILAWLLLLLLPLPFLLLLLFLPPPRPPPLLLWKPLPPLLLNLPIVGVALEWWRGVVATVACCLFNDLISLDQSKLT